MRAVRQDNNVYIVRFLPGERYVSTFRAFCDEYKIGGASFLGLGGFTEATIATFDLDAQAYRKKTVAARQYEVLSIVGNVARHNDDIVIHQHVTLADPEYRVIGGHLVDAVIGGTLELTLKQYTRPLQRIDDPDTGLTVLTGDTS